MAKKKSKKEEEWSEEHLNELYKYSEKNQKFLSFWRPLVGGLTFGSGGVLLVLGGVFGWVFYVQGMGIMFFYLSMLVGAIVFFIGVAYTS